MEKQIGCPRCGSKNVARYLYGYPAYSEDLKKKVDSGKIVFGGCCLSSVDVNGKQVFCMPEYSCNECKKSFGTPPIFYNKKEDKWEDYRDIVTGIRFNIGGYFGGFTEIIIKKNKQGATVHVNQPLMDPGDFTDLEDKQITAEEWNKIVCKLYDKFYIHEWNKNYADIGVLDGTQWEVQITLKGSRKRTYGGSNAYPPNWSAFERIFKEFAKF